MAGFTVRIEQFEINAKQFTAAMEKGCRELMQNAAKHWLFAVVTNIPVRTGFLVGAFAGLEDALGIDVPKMHEFIGYRKKRNGKPVHKDFIDDFKNLKNRRLELLEKQHEISQRLKDLHHARTVSDRRAETERGELTAASEHGKDYNRTNAGIDARIKKLNNRLANVHKRLERFNKFKKGAFNYIHHERRSATGSKEVEHVGLARTSASILNELNDIRRQILALSARERKRQGFVSHNPKLGEERARFRREYEDITKVTEHTQAERLAFLRNKANKGKKLEKKIEVLGQQLKKVLIREKKEIFAFKEYYTHSDGVKTLKTPRSGLEYATPVDEAFEEETPQELVSKINKQLQAAANYANRFSERKGIGELGTPGSGSTDPNTAVGTTFYATQAERLARDLVRAKTMFSFHFQVNIIYYDINDNYKTGNFGKKEMPWRTQQAGALAFYEYIKTNALQKLPQLESLVSIRQISFGGTNVPQTLRNEVNR